MAVAVLAPRHELTHHPRVRERHDQRVDARDRRRWRRAAHRARACVAERLAATAAPGTARGEHHLGQRSQHRRTVPTTCDTPLRFLRRLRAASARVLAARGLAAPDCRSARCGLRVAQRARGARRSRSHRAVEHAAFGDQRGHEPGGRHVERRVVHVGTGRHHPGPGHLGDLGAVPELDRDVGARCGRGIDGRRRRGDVERDVVRTREHRQRVRADLVRDVAVRGDPVGAHHHRVDRAGGEQRTGGGVDDDAERDAEPVELPRGEPCALQHRPRLVDPDGHGPAALVRGADHAERGAVPDARQCAGVAVREDRGDRREQRGAVRTEGPVGRHVRRGDRERPVEGRRRATATPGRERLVDAPREVHRGRARATEPAGGRRDVSLGRVAGVAANARPNAPVAPSAGAPRTVRSRIAATTSSTVRHSANTSSRGSRRWSTSRTAPSCHATVGGIGSKGSRFTVRDGSGGRCAEMCPTSH